MIFTDKYTYLNILKFIVPKRINVKIIIKEFENFNTYKYKEQWKFNHNRSLMNLHKVIDWKLNMLWNEKIFFVNEVINKKYYNTLFYAWCDIGYFRNEINNINTKYLKNWPNLNKLYSSLFNDNLIHYACIQNNINIINETKENIDKHYIFKKNNEPIHNHNINIFAGGFFLSKCKNINEYAKLYDEKLSYYFKNNFFIKDDQTIVIDIILNNPHFFYIHKENSIYNEWFKFQYILL